MAEQSLITPPQIAQHLQKTITPAVKQVISLTGLISSYEETHVQAAIKLALKSANPNHPHTEQLALVLSQQISHTLYQRFTTSEQIPTEAIQDQIELALMRQGEQEAAQAYRLRKAQRPATTEQDLATTNQSQQLENKLNTLVEMACQGLSDISSEAIFAMAKKQLTTKLASNKTIHQTLISACNELAELDPDYCKAKAYFLLSGLRATALSNLGLGEQASPDEMHKLYPVYFTTYLNKAIENELLDPALRQFDLNQLTAALKPERDAWLSDSSLIVLRRHYLLQYQDEHFELPQAFFMRIAMGLALNETNKEQRAIEFYHALSSFLFQPSEQTLLNAGRPNPELAAEFAVSAGNELADCYDTLKINAQLTTQYRTINNDWCSAFSNQADDKTASFIHLAQQAALINQTSNVVSASLPIWHTSIEALLTNQNNSLPFNVIIPDTFMRRVFADEQWTLFSAESSEQLNSLYGARFEQAYQELEQQAERGKVIDSRTTSAVALWRKLLVHLFETGYPQLSFQTPCQIRATQRTANGFATRQQTSCTGASLFSTTDKTPVARHTANINLAAHLNQTGLDINKLEQTISTAIRLLDNAINIDHKTNKAPRAISLGVMGWQEMLYQLAIPYGCEQAIDLADYSMEVISYFAIQASTQLAIERGRYEEFTNSLWNKATLPIDSLAQLAQARPEHLQQDSHQRLDWPRLREQVKLHGTRHANLLAITPCQLPSLASVSSTTEPSQSLLVTQTESSFTCVNSYLVSALKQRQLWDENLLNEIKSNQGSIQTIERIPSELKALFKTAFELDPHWLIEAASRRQKWLDQSQVFNLYTNNLNGSELDELYRLIWLRGLKTTHRLIRPDN